MTSRLQGLPKETWINTIETSWHDAGTAYVAINNYRNNDFANYVYKTTDFGQSWTSITGDLPADRVARTLREDPKNPNVLYLGTELGLFVSINGGRNWVELKNNMPTLPFNDLVVHPRDNDLVLGTHGRGVWILDNLNAIQELSGVINQQAALFSVPDAEIINYNVGGAHTGDMYYRGENPRRGAMIDYYLKDTVAKKDIKLSIHDLEGNLVNTVNTSRNPGIQRVYWNFAYQSFKPGNTDPNSGRRGRGFGLNGPQVVPGIYIARLEVNGQTYEQQFRVMDDSRLDVDLNVRRAWTESLFKIGGLSEVLITEMHPAQKVLWHLNKLDKDGVDYNADAAKEVRELNRKYGELASRIRSLYFGVSSWIGPWSGDQQAQYEYYTSMIPKLGKERDAMLKNIVPRLNRGLKKENRYIVEE